MDEIQNDVKTSRGSRLRSACLRSAAGLAALGASLLLRLAVLSDDSSLRLFLSPFARALELFFGYRSSWEAGRGFVIAQTGAVITEKCSGLGAFALFFPLLVFLSFPAGRGGLPGSKAVLRHCAKACAVSALAAFAANLLRLLSSQAFGPLKRSLGLDFYSAHNAEGMLLFLGAFLAGLAFMGRKEKS